MTVIRGLFTFLVVATAVLVPHVAAMADADAPSRSRVTELPLTTIYGERQVPGASYILTRSGQRYEVLDLRESFVREVVRSVDGGPF
jgi:hypothetical protein